MATTSYRDASRELKQMALRADALGVFCYDNIDLDVYLAGTFTQPGISDIDLLVLDEQPKISAIVEEQLIGGSVIVFPRHLFERIDMLERFELKMLQGYDIKRAQPPSDALFRPIEIIEWLPERTLLLRHMAFGQTINNRRAALVVKSAARSIENVAKHVCVSSDVRIRAASDAAAIVFDEACDVRALLLRYADECDDAWSAFERSFAPSACATKGTAKFTDYYAVHDGYGALLSYLHTMSQIDCELSHAVSAVVDIECTGNVFDASFVEFARERWLLLNEVFVWFKSKGYKRGMLKYGWLL